jgi:hypothetical protein
MAQKIKEFKDSHYSSLEELQEDMETEEEEME